MMNFISKYSKNQILTLIPKILLEKIPNKKIFIVGGFVRDLILNKLPNDLDIAIELSKSEFESYDKSFKQIGSNFPIYIIEGKEVALTRIEKSIGNTYQEFEIIKTGNDIISDLSRRDFSMGSLAINVSTSEIVDPFNGVNDIRNRVIRTINDNFVKEDPLRVYRLARFAAEFDFVIDKKTADIIKRDAKYIVNVNTERIYLELKKNYERSNQPSIFFRVLDQLGVLKYHFKPLFVATSIPAGPAKYHGSRSVFDHLLDSFDFAKQNGYSFQVGISALLHDFGKILTDKKLLPKHHGHEFRGVKLIEKFFEQHRFDAHTMKLAKSSSRVHMKFHSLTEMKSVKLVRFFKEIRNNVEEIVQVANCDHQLSEEQLHLLELLKRTFKETVIEVPKGLDKEKITQFVEAKYNQKFNELKREV